MTREEQIITAERLQSRREAQEREEKIPHSLGLYLRQDENPLAAKSAVGNDRARAGANHYR